MLIFPDSITYTESGDASLSLECYPLFGGQQCETVTQVNVNVSFLNTDELMEVRILTDLALPIK